MHLCIIDQADQELIAAASDIIARLYRVDQHHVGAALRTRTGKIFTAVHLEAYVGRIAVCAEAMVMGKAFSEGESDFDTIVAVRHPQPGAADPAIRVVAPCGMCRELMAEYGPAMKVIVPHQGQYVKCRAIELLPLPYRRP